MPISPYQVVSDFEAAIADFTGSPYGVAVDSCTSALLLCCAYLKVGEVRIPAHTYPSVPCSIIQAGGKVVFEDVAWEGIYQLKPYPIYDAAARLRRNMYLPKSFMCLSFHSKKHLPIGKGGMILTDDRDAMEWFKAARCSGRHACPLMEDNFTILGWNCYMEPQNAARGLMLLSFLEDKPDIQDVYPDLSKYPIYANPR
jgi:dTDP-4-amino-4,6-dideoxygalactose transaminase